MPRVRTWCSRLRQNLQKSRKTAFLSTACFSIQNWFSLCCYSVLSHNEYILILYNASASELEEGWQQDCYNSKAEYKPLPLSCVHTAQAPHSHTWDPRNSSARFVHDQKIRALLCKRNIIMCSQMHLFTSLAGTNVYCCLFHVSYALNWTENLSQSQL